ncbi:MAG: CHASE2 domain-containing protein [Verrucomicrobiales bacterium]|nr:CHASE2 domain-containing protein [Verrucomicrobiales bacterium]
MDASPRRKLLRAFVLATTLAFLGWTGTSHLSGWAVYLARASYDALHRWDASTRIDRASSPVVVVYLDLQSHLQLRQNPAERWNRELHADLVRRLTEAHARAIVFDIVFDTPWPDPKVDQQLAEAMRRHGRVILAAEHHQSEHATGRLPELQVQGMRTPVPTLREAAAGWGAAELPVDDDFIVRSSRRWVETPNQPTLAWATIQALGLEDTVRSPRNGTPDEWLRYYGPPLTLPHVSYHTVLDSKGVDPEFFRDRVVLIGARPMASVFGERRDELRNPLVGWRDPTSFMPGVEVHATQILNWMRDDALRRLPAPWESALNLVAAVSVALALVFLRPAFGTAVAAGIALGGFALGQTLFVVGGQWSSWLVISAVIAPAGWLIGLAHQGMQWQQQRKKLEQRRLEDARKIRRQATFIDQAQDIIVVTNLEGVVIYANPSGRRFLDLAAPQTNSSGSRAEPTFRDSEFESRRQNLLRHGEWSGTVELRPDPPNHRILESRWTLIRGDDGNPDSILMISTDVTERRRLEAEFLRAQRWEALGSLAGGMAHDLNNTLAPALLGLQMLGRTETRQEPKRLLAMIESRTRRGAEIVRNVLEFLRGGTLPIGEIHPADLLRELESVIQDSFPRNIQVVSFVPPRIGRVKGNVTQLHQALLNICVNARDAMPEGGQLTLAVDDVDLAPDEAATMRSAKPGNYVMIAISDSGIGIAPEHLDRIFDPLFTTKPDGKGTGLGLTSVAKIIDQHFGFIAVSSEVGAGSTFEIYLPRLTSRASEARPPTTTPHADDA